MSDIAIRVENLSKAYRIGLKEQIPDTLVGAMASWMRSPLRNFNTLRRLNTFRANGDAEDIVWALKDVSFDVKEGEVIGIIGRNGAGKSTLLKILSRITDPTSGMATIRGRVSSLLEVGTGFHPELTGRENIYMNGTILGMSKREIDRKFDEIVDFSGVEKFLDTPIKRYSSGMKVRLAFSVAAYLEPEILIIDEVLAVGDAEFQAKCLGKMEDVARGGRTVLFVSHNMLAVRELCERGVILSSGAVTFDGRSHDAVSMYLSQEGSLPSTYVNSDPSALSHSASLISVSLHEVGGRQIEAVESGSPVEVHVHFRARGHVRQVECALGVYATLGHKLLHFSSRPPMGFSLDLSSRNRPPAHSDEGVAICEIPSLPLTPGQYRLNVHLSCNREVVAYIRDALSFTVIDPAVPSYGWVPAARKCPFYLAHTWRSSDSHKHSASTVEVETRR